MMIDVDLLIACGGNFKKIPKGTTIFREDTPCSFYYQLVSGRIRWINITNEGREFIQTVIEPGDCFGEMPLFDDGPYASSAIADEDSVVIRIHKPVFDQLIKENQDIHSKFSRLLAKRLRYKFMLVKLLSEHRPEKIISSLLNYFKETRQNICGECHKLMLTRQQIADMTGLRVETVIRTMKAMQQKGEIQIISGKVYYKL